MRNFGLSGVPLGNGDMHCYGLSCVSPSTGDVQDDGRSCVSPSTGDIREKGLVCVSSCVFLSSVTCVNACRGMRPLAQQILAVARTSESIPPGCFCVQRLPL